MPRAGRREINFIRAAVICVRAFEALNSYPFETSVSSASPVPRGTETRAPARPAASASSISGRRPRRCAPPATRACAAPRPKRVPSLGSTPMCFRDSCAFPPSGEPNLTRPRPRSARRRARLAESRADPPVPRRFTTRIRSPPPACDPLSASPRLCPASRAHTSPSAHPRRNGASRFATRSLVGDHVDSPAHARQRAHSRARVHARLRLGRRLLPRRLERRAPGLGAVRVPLRGRFLGVAHPVPGARGGAQLPRGFAREGDAQAALRRAGGQGQSVGAEPERDRGGGDGAERTERDGKLGARRSARRRGVPNRRGGGGARRTQSRAGFGDGEPRMAETRAGGAHGGERHGGDGAPGAQRARGGARAHLGRVRGISRRCRRSARRTR